MTLLRGRTTTDPHMLALLQMRLTFEMTRAELALRSGFSEEAIASWEMGRRSPNLKRFSKLARALGLRVEISPIQKD